jgi:hypothetical protein
MLHPRMEHCLKLYFARQFQCKSNQIEIENLNEDQAIKGKVTSKEGEPEYFEFDYQETISSVLTTLLELDAISVLEGYHSVLSVHHEDLAYHTGLWMASQIKITEMPFIASQLNTDALGEDFSIAIRYLMEERYSELYESPQAQLEREIRAEFHNYSFYDTYLIPNEVWLNLLNESPTPKLRTVVDKIIQLLPEYGASQENMEKLRHAIAFNDYLAAIRAIAKNADSRINLSSQSVKADFDSETSPEEAHTHLMEQARRERELIKELGIYTELWAREGQNLLILNHTASLQRGKIIQEAIEKKQSAEECFEAMIIAASQQSPELSSLDVDKIVYVTSASLNELKALKNGDLNLSNVSVFHRDEIPTYNGLVLFVLNNKIEIVDILFDVSHRFKASEGRLTELRFALNDEERFETLDAIEADKSQILPIDEWIKEYKIQQDEEGNFIEIDFDDHDAINQAAARNLIWTEFDSGVIENRLGFVNRLRYLVGEVPHAKYEDKQITAINPKPNWEGFSTDELEFQISYAAQQLPREKAKLIQLIRKSLDESFDFIQDELEVADGDDLSHWTDRLESIYQAHAALELLN